MKKILSLSNHETRIHDTRVIMADDFNLNRLYRSFAGFQKMDRFPGSIRQNDGQIIQETKRESAGQVKDLLCLCSLRIAESKFETGTGVDQSVD